MSSRTLRSKRSDKPSQVVGAKVSAKGGVQVVVTEDPEESHPGRTCQVCRGMDTDEMVQCDDCQKWHHFLCVGVTQQIENFPWSCARCEAAKGVQEPSSTAGALQRSGCSSKRLPEANSNPLLVSHQQAHAQMQTSTAALYSAAEESIQPEVTGQVPFVSSLRWVVNTSREPSRNASKVSSVSSSRSSQALAKLKLQKLEELRIIERREAEQQRIIAAEEARKEKAFLEQKYQLLEQAMSESGSSKDDKASRTEQWVASASAHCSLSKPPNAVNQFALTERLGKLQVNPLTNARIGSSRSSQPEPNPPDPFPVPESMLAYSVDPPAPNRMHHMAIGTNNQEPLCDRSRLISSMGVPRRVSIAQIPQPCEYREGLRSNQPADPQRPMSLSAMPLQTRDSATRYPGAHPVHQLSQNVSTPDYQQFTPHLNRAPHSSTMRASRAYDQEEDMDPCPISRKQLAARQAISKDLPTFSGCPEEWPLFLSTFNSTTAMCGFTNEENIVRLQRSLKGRAYEAVKSRLLHPSNVNGVMSTLKMLFGQPEIIVHSMMSKINSLPPLKEDKLETLVDFAVSVENFCATVDACGLEEYLYNISFLHQLVNKLPPSIKLNWAQYRQTLPIANLPSFSSWLYSLAEAASAVTIPNVAFESKPNRSDPRVAKKVNSFVNAHSEDTTSGYHAAAQFNAKKEADCCPVCKESCKSIATCKRFLEFSRDSRWATVRDLGLCRRCLRRHKGGCQSKLCGRNGCELKHHELLHNDQKAAPPSPNTSSNSQNTSSSSQHQVSITSPPPNSSDHGCHTHRLTSSQVLFRYLPIVLHGKQRSIQTFAFLDDGSELTLVDEDLVNELELEGEPMPLCLHWTGGAKRREEGSRNVKLQVSAKHNESKIYTMNGVRTVTELLLPSQTLNFQELSTRYSHLKGLPVDSYQDVRPRILIGMKDQHLTLVQKSREGALHQPIAVKTRLGWTVCGGGNQENSANLVHSVFHVCACDSPTDDDLHRRMKEYFTLDSLGIAHPEKILRNAEEGRALSLLEARTMFKGDRYETGLLWRHDDLRLPDSRPMALRRLQCLKRRMDKDPELAEVLNSKISEFVTKGYARKLNDKELGQIYPRVWYLPIFPVTNINKPGKIRMVWDAAATAYGVSLNSVLLKGPDQLCELFSILIQFREGRIALTGDVREMFLQVLMRPVDQQCQRFLWYEEDGTLSVYILQVMSFGACCSPCSAQYVKNLNAERFKNDYPTAVEVIQKRHYVDDMLVSVDTEDEAIQLAQQVKHVHSEGGFEIRNWISNSKHVVQALQECQTEEKNLDVSSEIATEKVLGMWWCTNTDTFTYKVGWNRYGRALLEGQHCPTKREMLRVLMSMFDPLGLISQFLVYLKILLQEVWRSGVDWDDKIEGVLFEKWQTWLRVLPQVENLQIPRCYFCQLSAASGTVQLHTFVDASENGMAAACYLRITRDNVVECSLVAAKTRVAPLKFLSIPRLELQAAVIGTRLARSVSEALSIQISRRIFWSDSQDVLFWIKSDHRRYSQFVAFRVSEILDTTEMNEWMYVPTELNVADEGTKWKGLPDLTPQSRWYIGPQFLYHSEVDWPQSSKSSNTADQELRLSVMTHYASPDAVIHVEEYSNWKRIVKIVALLYRFASNCTRKLQRKPKMVGPISNLEFKTAESYLFRQAQQETFAEEIAHLRKPQENLEPPVPAIPKSSSLYHKSPWMDECGVLRMRGRISACEYATEDAKHPIILPRDHHTTKLIVAHYHQKYHHQNHETVVNEIRQKFSIPHLRSIYAKIRNSCQRCKNDRAVPRVPIMADLPAARLDAFTRPFTHVGVDFFGPYEVVIGRRAEKRWGMLATCLTIRAIHIEVVHSLSTDSCIMALQNFIARRGKPRTFFSDRGTNFIGARRVLQETENAISQEELMKEFMDADTNWTFLPPASPHMGGSWERLIGSVKKNLMAILPARKLTDEVLRNLLTEIESIVNSRPLTHVPIDDDSAPALTPNHFLLGSSSGLKPLSNADGSGVVLRQSWLLSQVQANQFWKRWVTDYLPEITRRTKWFVHTKPIEINDVVVIVDAKSPRNCWPKGRIINIQVGRDGQPRSATVRTAVGIYERPVAKLAVLDIRREAE